MKDQTPRALLGSVLLLVMLFGVSLLPPQNLFGVELKRANFLSELVEFEVAMPAIEQSVLTIDEEEYNVDMEAVTQSISHADSIMETADNSYYWIVDTLTQSTAEHAALNGRRVAGELTPIECPTDDISQTFNELYAKFADSTANVRIAVLGDSFIEADILTGDIRESLQATYGGEGAGFCPAATPLTQYRRTIKTISKGWQSHNIMQYSSTPASLRGDYSVSGWVSTPNDGASVEWRMTDAREHAKSASVVRILFKAKRNCTIEVAINGVASHRFEISGDESVRQIVLQQSEIASVKATIVSGASGFVGYGAIFEGGEHNSDHGVVVDNYSIRSNNGQAMLKSNASVNAQINRLLGGYDLVILQYGLNILQEKVSNYTAYGAQIDKMIAYVHECFPSAAVMVMAVSDRSIKIDGKYTPMPTASSLISYQREAATRSGAAFWDTHHAMRAQGGMANFVAQNWAGKDFTHINFAGGRQVAWALCDAIDEGIAKFKASQLRRVDTEPIINQEITDSIFE